LDYILNEIIVLSNNVGNEIGRNTIKKYEKY